MGKPAAHCIFGLHKWQFIELWNPPGFAWILSCYKCSRCGKAKTR